MFPALELSLSRCKSTMLEKAEFQLLYSPFPLSPSVKAQTSETVLVCGRICCDENDAYVDSHPTSATVLSQPHLWLEGDREIDQGARVCLQLGEVQSFSFFPGQTVMLKGINPTGNTFIVEDVMIDASLPTSTASIQRIKTFNQSVACKL